MYQNRVQEQEKRKRGKGRGTSLIFALGDERDTLWQCHEPPDRSKPARSMYDVLKRGNGRLRLFHKDGDEAFKRARRTQIEQIGRAFV